MTYVTGMSCTERVFIIQARRIGGQWPAMFVLCAARSRVVKGPALPIEKKPRYR